MKWRKYKRVETGLLDRQSKSFGLEIYSQKENQLSLTVYDGKINSVQLLKLPILRILLVSSSVLCPSLIATYWEMIDLRSLLTMPTHPFFSIQY